MTKKVSYAELEMLINNLGAQISAAETHGLLVGFFCLSRASVDESEWRDMLLENLDCTPPTQKQWEIFSHINKKVRDDFNDINFTFNMLLPEDELELEERIVALGYWCRGFLSGLALIGITSEDLKNDVVKELIHDLSQIAHISMDKDVNEEDEYNYMELVEYVRIAAQNIRLELDSVSTKKIIH